MRLEVAVAVGALVAVVGLEVAWQVWGAPKQWEKLRGAALLVLGGLFGFALGRKEDPPEEGADPAPAPPSHKETLEDAESTYATEDHFEEIEARADDLVDPARGDSLASELADFRAGAADLVGDRDDSG